MTRRPNAGDLLRQARTASGLSQRALARLAGTSSATVSLYESGAKEPRLGTLARLIEATGQRLDLHVVTLSGRDRTDARSLALHRAIADRLQHDTEPVVAHARRNLATMRTANDDGSADGWLDRWDRLLDGPIDELVAVLTSSDGRSHELRQNTPFAGVLPARDRWTIYRRFAP